ncbi:helicase HerA-like domain-containing protein [Candidatus Skiveiella danica]
MVRLRSLQGRGRVFVTQNLLDIPDSVLAQLGKPGTARPRRLYAA